MQVRIFRPLGGLMGTLAQRMRGPARSPLTLVALLLAILPLAGACGGSSADKAGTEFPSYVYASAFSLQSYRTAVRVQNALTQMPCYCGCEAKPSEHKNLKECFIKPDGSYNDHAAGCDVCGKEAIDVAKALDEGKSLPEVRAMIDAKYAVYGKGTDTPPVQGGE